MSTNIIASAAVFNSANIDTLNKKITVSGTVENSNMVTVYMVKSDTEEVVFDVNADNVEYINILPAEAGDYTYEFSYDEGGNYVIGAADDKGNKVSKLYNITDKSAIDVLAGEFSVTMTDAQIIEKITPYANSLNISQQNLNSNRDKKIICIQIRENINSISVNKAEGLISAVNSALKECDVIYKLEDAKQWYEVDAIITANSEIIGINLSKYQNSSKKNGICVDILNMTINTLEDVKKLIDEKLSSATVTPGGGGGGGGGFTPSTPVQEIITDGKEKPADLPVHTNDFSDLEDVLWAKDAIKYLADMGVLKGTGNNRFSPDNAVKREELAKMIVLAFGIEMKDGASFADVEKNQWYAPYISALVEGDISKGISENEFGVGKEVTRQDVAVILHRIMKNKEYNFMTSSKEFADGAVIADYAKEAVKDMTAEGIINGITETEFAPDVPATRAQAAKLIYEVMNKLKMGGNTNE